MAGNKSGGLKAKATNLAKNPNFYRDIGRLGGMVSKTGGFASEAIGDDGLTGRQRARIVGKKGGLISKRGKSKKKEVENEA